MNAKDVKDSFQRTVRDVKEEFNKSEVSRKMKPAVVVLLGLLCLIWVFSGGPLVLVGTAASVAIIGILGAVILGPALWVYYDATRREVKHPLGWGIFSLLTWPIGWLIYYLIKPDQPGSRACQSCERKISTTFAACPYCGTSQASTRRSCPSCQSEIDPEWQFCPYCRMAVGNPSSTPEEEGVAAP